MSGSFPRDSQMHSPRLGLLAVLTVLALSSCAAEQQSDGDTTQDSATTAEQRDNSTSDTVSMEEVQEHAHPESCWAAIEGSVYDLTPWIAEHPGGPSRIEQLCGTDATQAFLNQHGAQEKPQDQLSEFFIGPLDD